MNTLFKLVMSLFFSFMCLSVNSEHCKSKSSLVERTKLRISAMKDLNKGVFSSSKNYQNTDTIKVKVNGNLFCDGDCEARPMWGLLRKNGKNWETLIDVTELKQINCGPISFVFDNLILEICVIDLLNLNHDYYPQYFIQGEYKFTALTSDRDRIILSNAFSIN